MEYRRKCSICGCVWCYTSADEAANRSNTINSVVSSVGTIVSAFAGTRLDTYALSGRADRYGEKVVDFTQCPQCRSRKSELISDEEWEDLEHKARLSSMAKRVEINSNATTETLLRRVSLFLEESDWASANAYCESVLDTEPENAQAHLGKLLAECKAHTITDLAQCEKVFDNSPNYRNVVKFGDEEVKNELLRYLTIARKNVEEKAKAELQLKENQRKYAIYEEAISLRNANTVWSLTHAIELFQSISDWRDSGEQIQNCQAQLKEIKRKQAEKESKLEKVILIGALATLAILILTIIITF